MHACALRAAPSPTFLYTFLLLAENPWGISPCHVAGGQFFGLWISPSPITATKRAQLGVWASSLRFFHPAAHVWLFSAAGPGALDTSIGDGFVRHVHVDHRSIDKLLQRTPAEAVKLPRGTPYPQLSDLLRLAMLFRWGGSLIDTDDILIRPAPTGVNNVIGTIEWPGRRANSTYFAHRFERLIPAGWYVGC